MSELEHKRRAGPATDAEVAGRLLAVAKPQGDAAREADLLERIMASAERTPRLASVAPASEAPKPRTEAVPAAATRVAPAFARRVAPRRDVWAAAGALAASLVIGLVAGQMSLPNAAVHRLAEVSGVSLTSATHDVATVLAAAEFGDDD